MKLLEEIPTIYRNELEETEATGKITYSRESIRQLDLSLAMLRELILTLRQAGINISITEYFDTSSLNVRLTFPIEKKTVH